MHEYNFPSWLMAIPEKIHLIQLDIITYFNLRKEEAALRNIALAHKTQKDARVILENKMALLKQKARLQLPDDVSECGLN